MIDLPAEAIEYIKAQRNSLQRAKLATDKYHTDQWVASCQAEADWLLKHVPKGGVLLDIGCGLGGIDVLLAPHFDHLHLLDGTGWDERRAGYQQSTHPWNSLDLTREIMIMNGLHDKTTLIEYRERPDIHVDVVISTTSWCYHYRSEEYLSWVAAILKPGGHLCVDLRFSDDFFSECDKIINAGMAPTSGRDLIKWGNRWKGMRQVYVEV